MKRASDSFQPMETILSGFDKVLGIHRQSGKHPIPNFNKDVAALAKQFVKQEIFMEKPNGKHNAYPTFPENTFKDLDIPAMKQWMCCTNGDEFDGFELVVLGVVNAAVQEKDFEDGTDTSSNSEDSDVELLSPLSELNSSSSDDESYVGRVKCQCKGKCQRKCPCKEANEQCELLERKEIIELLAGMAKFSPALWDQVKKPSHSQEGNNDIGDVNNTPVETPSWCKCGQCIEMPTQAERACCQNDAKKHEHPLFENHCLTEHNLELAMQSNADHLNYPFDPSNNACWRYTAYRQYTIWVWGKLGRSNRKVIPSCIVHKIRKRFPDHNAVYTGFMDNEYYL
eukprot:gene12428-13713_t